MATGEDYYAAPSTKIDSRADLSTFLLILCPKVSKIVKKRSGSGCFGIFDAAAGRFAKTTVFRLHLLKMDK